MASKPTVRRVAWSTRSNSSGHILQWSRWHLTTTLTRHEKTLCGAELPFAKWITPQPGDTSGDYRIRGGACQACLAFAAGAGLKV